MNPYDFPFSLLDFGLTALALLVMGVIGYLGIRAARLLTTEVVALLRSLVSEMERHTEISRGMMNEFYHLAEEVAQLRREVHGVQPVGGWSERGEDERPQGQGGRQRRS